MEITEPVVMTEAKPFRRLLLVSNFGEPGRGTFVVANSLKKLPSFTVVPFDIYENRFIAGRIGFLVALARLFKGIFGLKPDVILADTQIGIISGYLCTRLFARKAFVVRQGGVVPTEKGLGLKSRVLDHLRSRAFNAAALCIVPSKAVAQSLEAAGVSPDAIVVISNGIEAPALGLSELRQGQRIEALTVGRLDANKSVEIAVGAVAIAAIISPSPIRLSIIGKGPEERKLRDQAQSMDPGSVVFRGFTSAPWQEMAPNSVLLHPAKHEGFGYVVLEAIMRGIPVLTFAGSGGSEEIVSNTGGGVVVQERSAASMAAGLIELFSNVDALRIRMADASSSARSAYSMGRMLSAYDDSLAAVCAS